jgi:heme A synthase
MVRGSDRRSVRDGRPRRVSRPVGCLLWVVGFVIFLLVLSLMFGGFQQGKKAGLACTQDVGRCVSAGSSALSGRPRLAQL